MRLSLAAALPLVAGATVSAGTLQNGDFIYTSKLGSSFADAVFFDRNAATNTNLLTNTNKPLGGIEWDDGARIWLGSSPPPQAPPNAQGEIWKFQRSALLAPFVSAGPEATFSNLLASGGDLHRPLDFEYDAASSQLLAANNSGPLLFPDAYHGILGVGIPSGTQSAVLNDPNPSPMSPPNWEDASMIITDPTGVGDYLFGSPLGGTQVATGQFNSGSTLWRLNGTSPGATAALVVDFGGAAVFNDLGTNLTFVSDVEPIPGTNDVLVADRVQGMGTGIYRLSLNPDGTYNSMTKILDPSDYADMDSPSDLAWDPFNNKILWVNRATTGNPNADTIVEMNPDGTGINVLVTGVEAGNILLIPTPGAMALLGLGGLMTLRRRR